MALSFACPACRAELQLPDTAAGQAGQCPRCQSLIRVPSSTHFRAEILQRGGNAPPDEPAPTVPAPKAPPYERDRTPAPRRAPRSTLPAAPTQPLWPAAVGVLGIIIVMGLLLASVIALFSVRGSI